MSGISHGDLAVFVFLGVLGAVLLPMFLGACWMAASVTRDRHRSRGW